MNSETALLFDITLMLIVAGICSIVLKKLRLPTIIGYLIAGFLLGPHIFPEVVIQESTVSIFASMGIVLLMFYIGLELNLRGLRKVASYAMIIVAIEMTMMVVIGYALGLGLGMGGAQAISASQSGPSGYGGSTCAAAGNAAIGGQGAASGGQTSLSGTTGDGLTGGAASGVTAAVNSGGANSGGANSGGGSSGSTYGSGTGGTSNGGLHIGGATAVANMGGKIRAAEVRQRTRVLRAVAGILQRQGAVRIGQRPQVVRCVAHIADGGNDALGNAALDGEVVVLRVGRG